MLKGENMPLRKHQLDMEAVVAEIIAGKPIRDIICKVTPGGGKSSLPIIAGRLIQEGLADAICWICPRMTLQDQAERNFLDPYFRHLFHHSMTIRASTNERNPTRGTNGFVTTYQAIGVDQGTALQEFQRRRYILVLDEYHHAEEKGVWTQALQPLYELAAFRVLMTGTMERGDKKKIAFTPYETVGDLAIPVLQENENTIVIEYSRKDALRDKAILPLSFTFLGGAAKWRTDNGLELDSKLSTKSKKTASHALYTALRTEYAEELLNAAIASWHDVRAKNQRATMLVVSASIESAKRYTEYLTGIGLTARIATSEDSDDALQAIKALKNNKIDILVTVAMAYEGLDVPSISHIACLTNIRSVPWIEQMVARAVRIDPFGGPYETQFGYVFCPDDRLMQDVVKRIESEQASLLGVKEKKKKMEPVDEDLFGAKTPGIIPLSSQVLGRKEVAITAEPIAEEIQTPTEIETGLLAKIESHIRQYAFQNRYNPKKINWELMVQFGKSRREMTISELKQVLAYCEANLPLAKIRGTGRPRVSTKGQPIEVRWA